MLSNEGKGRDRPMMLRNAAAEGDETPHLPPGRSETEARTVRRIPRGEFRILVAVTALIWVLTAVYLATTTPKYTASVTIGSAALDSQASAPSGISSLGISLPISFGGPTKPTDKYIYIISTPGFARRLMDRGDFAKLIFADRWDGQQWIAPKGVTNTITMWLRELFGYQAWAPPDEYDVSNYLNNNIILRPDTTTDFVEVSFDHRDPAIAARVVDIVTAEGDRYLKEANEEAYQSQVAFITRRIAEAANLEVANALRSYLINVVLNKTLIDESTKYAVRVWGSTSVSSLPTKPPVLLAALLGFILGPIVAFSIIFFGRWIRTDR
ncbi:hypothetical protein ACFW16_19810 [Inquilinus sp. NPDC058860]|uniref:hypothetical protein n=1 Tax=Inquilinus sp. NPDC058860 TaxID=3346652 RepID=UPI0036C52DD5